MLFSDFIKENNTFETTSASGDETVKYAKIIWEKLEVKYGADDAGKKKYVVGEWLRFWITDDKPITEQVHVYEN